jgi:hypothetical protein
MRFFHTFFLVAALVSCDRESISEKEVNAKYKTIQRKWQFVSKETVGAGADSVRIELFSGAVDWRTSKCKYTDEGANYNYCGGNGDFNDQEANYRYGYYATEGWFMLGISPSQNTKDAYILGQKLNLLINGRWKFEATGETFTATQISNERLPGVLTTLKAIAL